MLAPSDCFCVNWKCCTALVFHSGNMSTLLIVPYITTGLSSEYNEDHIYCGGDNAYHTGSPVFYLFRSQSIASDLATVYVDSFSDMDVVFCFWNSGCRIL